MGKKRRLTLEADAAAGEGELVIHTDLTEELREQICKLTRRGHSPDTVCDYLGITHAAFARWIRNGRMYVEGNQEPAELRPFGVLYQEYRRAWARYRMHLVNHAHDERLSPGKEWIRFVTILERRDKRNYGKKEMAGGNVLAANPNEKFL